MTPSAPLVRLRRGLPQSSLASSRLTPYDAFAMSDALARYAEVVQELDLQPGDRETFIGRRRGFPVALKLIASASSALLLCQVRHPLLAEAPQCAAVRYPDELASLLADRAIEVSIEDRIAWISFIDAEKELMEGSVLQRFDAILEAFAKAGLGTSPDLCHYCTREKVEHLTFHDGRVAQICPACLQSRSDGATSGPVNATAGSSSMLLLCPLAALVGAVGWMLAWAGFDRLFDFFGTNTLHIPHLLLGAGMLIVGGLVGGPVGWVLRSIHRKGERLSKISAVTFSITGVLAGEVFYFVWLTYRELGVVSADIVRQVMAEVYTQTDPFQFMLKLMTAGAAVATAVLIGRKPQPKRTL